MTTNGPQTIALLLRELGLLHGSVDSITAKMGKMKVAIGGAVAAFAGFKALQGLWDIVKAASELNKELNRTKQLGGEFAASVGQARLTAFNTTYSVPTTTPAENVRVQRELATQLQNPAAAADILPLAQKSAYVVSNFTGEKVEDIVKNLVKVADLRAQIFKMGPDGKEIVDPGKVQSELDAAAKGLILGGGYIKSNDLVQMARQAGVPAKGMTQEAFYGAMVEMAVSQGASRAGTSVTSLFSQMIGGTMPVHVAQEMQRVGLMSAREWKSDHGHVVLAPSVSQRLQGVQTDPIGYITGPLNDLLTQRGMDSQQKLMEVFKLFGRQTTQRLVAEAFSAEPQFERARHMFHDIPDPSKQYDMLQKEDLDTNLKSFEAAWHGLLQALGEQGVPVAITILHNLTDALHAMTAWAVQHPDAVRYLLEFAAAVAGLAAVGGTLAVATVAFGPFAAGIKLLVSAMSGAGAAGTAAGLLAGKLRSLLGAIAGGQAATGAAGAGEVAVAGAGATAAGTAVLGPLAVGAAGAYIVYKEASKTPEEQAADRARLELLRRQERRGAILAPQDYDDEGNRIPPRTAASPFLPPSPAANQNQPVNLTGTVNLDGNRVGNLIARGLTGPSSGPTAGDMRLTPHLADPVHP